MARNTGQRALALNYYFTNEYAFSAERYISGPIIFVRRAPRRGVERIVVKHAKEVPFIRRGEEVMREDEIYAGFGHLNTFLEFSLS